MYHRVRPRLESGVYPNRPWTVMLDQFEAQIKHLKERYKIIDPDDFLRAVESGFNFPERSVLLTFDDGQYDFNKYAFPVLKRHGLKAVAFLPTNYTGKNDVFWWDRLEDYLFRTVIKNIIFRRKRIDLKKKDAAMKIISKTIKESLESKIDNILEELRLMLKVEGSAVKRSSLTWEEIGEMVGSGIVFGGHTHNHVNLAQISDEAAQNEILLSKIIIEENTGKKTELFAYPYGSFTPANEKMVQEAGFRAAFSTIGGFVDASSSAYSLKRVAVSGYENMFAFRLKMRLGRTAFLVKVLNKVIS
jgi:peptidoglycan/xylan/chitin deacetylase (PgdA/CDA1 family)